MLHHTVQHYKDFHTIISLGLTYLTNHKDLGLLICQIIHRKNVQSHQIIRNYKPVTSSTYQDSQTCHIVRIYRPVILQGSTAGNIYLFLLYPCLLRGFHKYQHRQNKHYMLSPNMWQQICIYVIKESSNEKGPTLLF